MGVAGGSQVPYQLRYAARLGLFVKMAEKRVWVWGGSQVPYQLRYAARLGLFVKMAEKRGGGGGGGGGQSGALPHLRYVARLGLFVKMAEKRVWVWGASQVPYQLRYAARLGLFVKMAEKRVGGGAVRCPTPLALCGPARSLCKNGRET